jgi:hypothetical protein
MDLYVRNPLGWEFDPPFCAASRTMPWTVLELGSGTGVVGYRIANEWAQRGRDIVIVTDLPEVCPLLETNVNGQIKRNTDPEDGVILVRPLAWGNSEHALRIASELHPRTLTHIVCSDLVGAFSHPPNPNY